MAWVIMLTSYMIFQDKELSEASMYFLKILLSLSGAVMLATLPGFMDINYSVGGLSIRAAGGAAAFVFIYTQSPHLPALKSSIERQYPAERMRPGPTSSNDSFTEGAFPFMVALSLDPSGLFPGASTLMVDTSYPGVPAGPGQTVIESNDGDTGTGGGDTILIGGSGSDQPSTAGAVVTIVYEAARDGAVYIIGQAVAAVDSLATNLRMAVAWIGEKTATLVASLLPAETIPTAGIYEFVAELPKRTSELMNTALAPAIDAVGALTAQLEDSSSLLAHVGDTVRAAPETLTTAVRETAEAVPHVVHGTVETLNSTVGGLTDTVGDTLTSATGTVGGLVTGVLHSPKDAVTLTTQAVGSLTDTVADTTRGVLASTKTLAQGVGDQVRVITSTLNDVTPALIEKIDPDFDKHIAATGRLREASERVLGGTGRLAGGLADHTASLPALSDVKLSDIHLPQAPALREPRLLDRIGGGAGAVAPAPLLPPIAATASLPSISALDGAVSRAAGRAGSALSGGIGSGAGSSIGDGPGGGGAVLGSAPVLGGGPILGPAPVLGGGSGPGRGGMGGGSGIGGGSAMGGGGPVAGGSLSSIGGGSGGAGPVSSTVSSVGSTVGGRRR